jgi:hypothetical protein
VDTRTELLGDNSIREKSFHHLWYQSIDKYTSPEKIIIVDSHSPVKPDINQQDARLQLISLNVNAGHSTNHIGKYCGYTRAILVALEYALQCDIDYFVYVEQDALLYGEGIVEYCIEQMTAPIMYGSGEGTNGLLQQSFFIIRKDAILSFVNKLNAIQYTDNELSPENKFHIASSFLGGHVSAFIKKHDKSSKICHFLDWQLFKYAKNWQNLPIAYGRSRPINFADNYFYFQHGNEQEILDYLEVSGLKVSCL